MQSVARAFAVIKAFASQPGALTIADVARRTDLSRAVARRFLLTLTDLGYVSADDGEFRLSPRVLELGYTFLSTLKLPDVAQPIMEHVVERLHESCSLSVLDGDDIVYVARVPNKRIMAVNLAVGSRLPAHATSMGRVLLAGLDPLALDAYLAGSDRRPLTARTVTDAATLRRLLTQVRERGWAMVDQEVEQGVRSVAAPISTRSGRTVAAINVSSHASRVSLKEMRAQHLPVVQDAAARISDALAGTSL